MSFFETIDNGLTYIDTALYKGGEIVDESKKVYQHAEKTVTDIYNTAVDIKNTYNDAKNISISAIEKVRELHSPTYKRVNLFDTTGGVDYAEANDINSSKSKSSFLDNILIFLFNL